MKPCRCRTFATLLSFIALIVFVAGASAAPMFGTEWKLKQPDGTFVDVRIFGDEYYKTSRHRTAIRSCAIR